MMLDLDLYAGFRIVTSVYLGCALLTWLLPGRQVVGYACDCYTGKPLLYKLNGLSVLVLVVAMFLFLGYLDIISFGYIAQHYFDSLFIANIYGLIGSAVLYIKGRNLPANLQQPYQRCPTRDKAEKPKILEKDLEKMKERSMLTHFFLGQEFNPRMGLFDLKMFLYVVGAVMLGLNVYSAAGLQMQNDGGRLSIASLTYSFMFTHFLVEYLYFEEIHLYTYDLFCEKVGFKLFWGCFVFYPFFYAIGTFGNLKHKPSLDLEPVQAILIISLFYMGWVLTRGANMQKFYFKRDPHKKTCFKGMIQQDSIPGSMILCSGFWGLSRHINYLGETIQAIALSLPGWLVSGSVLPWLYPLYYVFLFTTRQMDDDKICLEKYGTAWEEYMKRVPYRIVPYIW